MPGTWRGGFAEAARGQECRAFAVTGPADPDVPGLAVTMAAAITRTLRCGPMGNLSPPAARSGRCLVLAGCGESARQRPAEKLIQYGYVPGGQPVHPPPGNFSSRDRARVSVRGLAKT